MSVEREKNQYYFAKASMNLAMEALQERMRDMTVYEAWEVFIQIFEDLPSSYEEPDLSELAELLHQEDFDLGKMNFANGTTVSIPMVRERAREMVQDSLPDMDKDGIKKLMASLTRSLLENGAGAVRVGW